MFKFKKNDRIGSSAAEDDSAFLYDCFIDTGDLSILKNIDDNRQIVVGRTGSGKSALLAKLSEIKSENVIKISPESLALTYISNSTIMNYFESLGVNLDPFFKLLWRHIFTIEVLNKHLSLDTPEKKRGVFERAFETIKTNAKKKKEAQETISYIKKWGQSFWQETEYRVKEITNKVESDLCAETKAITGIDIAKIEGKMDASMMLSEEKKAEVRSRAQNIISKAQIQDLYKVMELLELVLTDNQQHYFIVIDKLDENWVEEKLRYKLIMALLVTAREIGKIKNVKLIVAMRRDLINRVFRLCRESGFQEEKYQSLYLPLYWNNDDLINVLDARIDYLVKSRYTKSIVTHTDLLPKQVNKIPITDYISTIARRPRDIISLFNKCIEGAPNLSKLSVSAFKLAVGEYSRTRLRALADEWSADYPYLLEFAKILNRRSVSFKMKTLKDSEIEEFCLNMTIMHPEGKGVLQLLARNVVDLAMSPFDFKKQLILAFYKIGLVGLKILSVEKESWVDELGRSVSFAEINDEVSIVINPMYHRALGINDKKSF